MKMVAHYLKSSVCSLEFSRRNLPEWEKMLLNSKQWDQEIRQEQHSEGSWFEKSESITDSIAVRQNIMAEGCGRGKQLRTWQQDRKQ